MAIARITQARTLTEIESEIYHHLDSGREQLLGAAQNAHRIGELLIEGKELLPHGNFIEWATTKFGFSARRAQQLMGEVKSETLRIQSAALLLSDNNRINSGLMSSETPEWYTPDDIIERAVLVLGGIDLDPCSNSHTDPRVPANVHYTKADDGLRLPWSGSVYMNPPYGDEIAEWIQRLSSEWQVGNVIAAVALVPARTDTAWFQYFRDSAVCFIRGRLHFSGSDNSAPFPSAAIYLGSNRNKFAQAFGTLGDIWIRME